MKPIEINISGGDAHIRSLVKGFIRNNLIPPT